MRAPLNLLAFDLGASNGRAILGRFDGNRIDLQELHRFENNYIPLSGTVYWDVLELFRQMKQGLQAFRQSGLHTLDCFGIDTWGVDYGLLDKNGHLLGNPRSYRAASDADMQPVFDRIPFPELFARTGIAAQSYNTLFQLYKRKQENDAALQHADTLLFLPDLLGYFFTGEKRTEYTIATTSMLLNARRKDWDQKTIVDLGLPETIFTGIDRPGVLRGKMLRQVAEECGLKSTVCAAVGSHDTASAVAAIPGSGNFAFCSSGTWSLFGIETDEPVLTDSVRDANFSNEGTVQGGFRPLKNIMGLWIIQECRRDWIKAGRFYSWDDLVSLAEQAEPFRSIIDPDHPAFFTAGNMEQKIRQYCQTTKQPVPETPAQTARCIYESLALKYRWALERLQEINTSRIDQLNITGGGIQNRFLNQLAADATNRLVVTGPREGAAIGNLLTQAMALGEVGSISELREIVCRSEQIETWHPHHTQAWEDAYEKLLDLSAGSNADSFPLS